LRRRPKATAAAKITAIKRAIAAPAVSSIMQRLVGKAHLIAQHRSRDDALFVALRRMIQQA
jgi:hypothetical protein